MGKVIVTFLISVYLIPAPGISELFKIKSLLSHFKETQHLHPDKEYTEFLLEHYLTDDGNPNDNNTDSRLPFKSRTPVFTTGFIYSSGIFPYVIKADYIFVPVFHSLTVYSYYAASFETSIWHPPQF